MYKTIGEFTYTDIFNIEIETYCEKMDFLIWVLQDYRNTPDEEE